MAALGSNLISHTFTRQWASGNESIVQSETVSAGAQTAIDETLAVPSTNAAIIFTCDVSQVKGLYIAADQDMTLKFNSSSSPDFTISLKANKPIIWSENCGFANPLTTDVTSLYVTIAAITGVAEATLKIRVLYDPTV